MCIVHCAFSCVLYTVHWHMCIVHSTVISIYSIVKCFTMFSHTCILYSPNCTQQINSLNFLGALHPGAEGHHIWRLCQGSLVGVVVPIYRKECFVEDLLIMWPILNPKLYYILMQMIRKNQFMVESDHKIATLSRSPWQKVGGWKWWGLTHFFTWSKIRKS